MHWKRAGLGRGTWPRARQPLVRARRGSLQQYGRVRFGPDLGTRFGAPRKRDSCLRDAWSCICTRSMPACPRLKVFYTGPNSGAARAGPQRSSMRLAWGSPTVRKNNQVRHKDAHAWKSPFIDPELAAASVQFDAHRRGVVIQYPEGSPAGAAGRQEPGPQAGIALETRVWGGGPPVICS